MVELPRATFAGPATRVLLLPPPCNCRFAAGGFGAAAIAATTAPATAAHCRRGVSCAPRSELPTAAIAADAATAAALSTFLIAFLEACESR